MPNLVGAPAKNRASAAAFAKHWTAVLAPTPRGSNPTMSKRARTLAEKIRAASCGRSLVPEPPGPPGSQNNVPIRLAGSVARCLANARLILSPRGCS